MVIKINGLQKFSHKKCLKSLNNNVTKCHGKRCLSLICYYGHIIFVFSGVRMLGFRSFEGKVFIVSLPNVAWGFIGLIACMALPLVKVALCYRVSIHMLELLSTGRPVSSLVCVILLFTPFKFENFEDHLYM